MSAERRLLATVSLLTFSLAACPAPGGEGAPDGGAPDAGADPRIGRAHAGAFLGAFPKAVLPGVENDVTVVALQSTVGPTSLFRGEGEFRVFGGLAVIDGATGDVQLHDERDGLPLHHYFDEFTDYGSHVTSFFDLAWTRADHAFAAAGLHHAVRGVVDDAGLWAFTSATLRAPGKPEDATLRHLVVDGGELFVTTDQGLAVLDPGTLATKRWADLGVSLAGPWVDRVVAADFGGPAVVATLGPANAKPDRVAVVPRAGQTLVLAFAEGETALSMVAVPGGAVLGMKVAGGGAIDFLKHVDGGLTATRIVNPDLLVTESGERVVPNQVTWDAARSVLVVGGALEGSGLVEIPLSGERPGATTDLFDRRDPYVTMLPWRFDALASDVHGRLWASGVQLCNEYKLRPLGLVRIDGAGDREALRVVRPVISGVRSVATGPSGETWLGLRDENAGLACDGIVVQQELCRPRADGTCEVWTPRLTTDTKDYTVTLGASAIAFGSGEAPRFAIATRRDATFVRIGDETRELSTQIDPGLSLDMTSAAWGPDGALWLGSETKWSSYPDLDETAIDARSPHGLGLLEFNDRSSPALTRRYVRVEGDSYPEREIPGLPSNTVWDVLPLEGRRRALVATGIERDDGVYDHLLPAANRRDLRGGLALIDDETVTVLAPPAGVRFGDVAALARIDATHALALDAAAGVFRVDVGAKTVTKTLEIPWDPATRGLSLATDGTRVLVGTSDGVWLHDALGWRHVDASIGFAWKVGFAPDGTAFAGSDEGFTRYAFGTDVAPVTTRPAGPLARDPWPLPLGCHGEQDCACDSANDCAPTLACACGPDTCQCTDADTCRTNDDCDGGRICGESGTCIEPPPPDCAKNCSCDTANGCPDGMTCRSGIVGFSCVP